MGPGCGKRAKPWWRSHASRADRPRSMPRSFSKSVNHLRGLFARKPAAEEVEMSGRRVIVTGASPNSLGYETARILASWGASVVVTRTRGIASLEDALKEDLRRAGADEENVKAHLLDLCDVDSVNRFATWHRKHHEGKLHVLINNAGIHRNILRPRKEPPPSKDGFEIHWRTNYLGTFHLTSLLLPLAETERSGVRRRARYQRLFPPARQSQRTDSCWKAGNATTPGMHTGCRSWP